MHIIVYWLIYELIILYFMFTYSDICDYYNLFSEELSFIDSLVFSISIFDIVIITTQSKC